MELKAQRNSNLELLRIIAMIAIIAYHFYTQTEIFTTPVNAGSHWIAMFLGSFGRTGVNLFVMIGAWFLVDLPFKSMRFIRLYSTCFLYTVLITGAVLIAGHSSGDDMAFKEVLRSFTPFSSSPLWFVSDYLFLLLLTPFLNTLILALPLEKYKILVGIIVVVFVVIPTVENLIPGFNVYKYYIVKSDMSWMIALYMLVGYWKRRPNSCFEREGRAAWCTALLISGCAVLCMIDCFGREWMISAFLVKKFHAFLEYLFMDMASAFCFLLAVSTFFLFKRFTFNVPIVNRIARNILGIYVIHQVPVFIPVLWGWFSVGKWIYSPWFLLYEIGTILTVFVVFWGVDSIREAAMTPLLNSALIQNISKKWDVVFNATPNK